MKNEMKQFQKKLPVDLTDEEVRHRGEEMARRLQELDEIEDDLQDEKDRAKSRRKPVQERLDDLKKQVLARKEERMVDCEERIDWSRNCAETFRHDTLKIIGTRPLTVDERQMKLRSVGGQADLVLTTRLRDARSKGGEKKEPKKKEPKKKAALKKKAAPKKPAQKPKLTAAAAAAIVAGRSDLAVGAPKASAPMKPKVPSPPEAS